MDELNGEVSENICLHSFAYCLKLIGQLYWKKKIAVVIANTKSIILQSKKIIPAMASSLLPLNESSIMLKLMISHLDSFIVSVYITDNADCDISIAYALEIPQSCTKPAILSRMVPVLMMLALSQLVQCWGRYVHMFLYPEIPSLIYDHFYIPQRLAVRMASQTCCFPPSSSSIGRRAHDPPEETTAILS